MANDSYNQKLTIDRLTLGTDLGALEVESGVIESRRSLHYHVHING